MRDPNYFPIRAFLHTELERLETCSGRTCQEVSAKLPLTQKQQREVKLEKEREQREREREREQREEERAHREQEQRERERAHPKTLSPAPPRRVWRRSGPAAQGVAREPARR